MSSEPQRTDDLTAFRDALRDGDLHNAKQFARRLLAESTPARVSAALRNAIDAADKERLNLRPFRIALLSSYSIEFIHDALVCQGFLEDLDVRIYQAGFDQYRQEILTEHSGLQGFEPHATVLAVEGTGWIPSVFEGSLQTSAEEHIAAVGAALAELEQLAKVFASRIGGLLLVHDLDPPRIPALGILDGKTAPGQNECVMQFNSGLRELARRMQDLHVVDYAGLVAELGREQWYDRRMAHYAKAPVSSAGLSRLAAAYARYMRARVGATRKCLVLDLDNTLWGGVVGESGVNGIQLGPDYPGSAFVEFQKAVQQLSRRGVLLAIASKNNPEDVSEVFERHDQMVLRESDFIAARIHWNPKSESLRSIAEELNLGLEHFVFVDDNPAECEQVRIALPMVTVVDLPKSPERYVETLMRHGFFDALTFSDEDRRRGELYRQRRQAENLKEEAVSLETYYRQLEMRVAIEQLCEASVTRAAQMTQKTNQFNVTTRRYTEGELRVRADALDWLLLTVRASDRFGDHGIVGLLFARERDDALDIDTLLLSCRVIGRTLETAMLSALCDEAARRGRPRLTGTIVSTARNAPVLDLFERHGFERVGGSDTESTWSLRLDERTRIECPGWIALEVASSA